MTKYIKDLRLIYFTTLISPILIIVIFLIVIEKGTIMLNDNIDEVFQFLIPIFGTIFISLGFLLFKRRLEIINKEDNANSKLLAYKGISIQRIAFIEGIAIFSAIGFLITLNYLYIGYTFIALAFYLPIFPSLNRISKELKINQDLLSEEIFKTKKPTSFFGKNPWLIIPLIAFMIILNYNSFKDFFSNKVVLPNIQVDNGTISDSIYHNDYLDWTFVIPLDYKEIPISEIEMYEKKGNKLLNKESDKNEKPIRLLNISNGLIDFKSSLNPRVLYPNIIDEEKYLEIIDKQFQDLKIESVTFEKQNQGVLLIDSLEFNYVEYFVIGEKRVGMMFLTRFNKDFIFDITMSYTDTQKAIELLTNLKTSDLNWK